MKDVTRAIIVYGLIIVMVVGGIFLISCKPLLGNYIPQEEAENWEWDGKISSLNDCSYVYVIPDEEPSSGWSYKGKALASKDEISFPADCKTAYNWCMNNHNKNRDYFNRNVDKCYWSTSHSWGCGGIMCDKGLYEVNAIGKCICTLDELEVYENSSWLVKKTTGK